MRSDYFKWMCGLVGNWEHYQELLEYLHCTEFYSILSMDRNRAEDGISLRYHYCQERHLSDGETARFMRRDEPCSVLEMMIALARRCEDDIMANSEIGDRTGLWFWDMISSLGLRDMDDIHFDERIVRRAVIRFLERDYAPDGRGGLFYLPELHRDLRDVEIWYQAMWYLSEFKE